MTSSVEKWESVGVPVTDRGTCSAVPTGMVPAAWAKRATDFGAPRRDLRGAAGESGLRLIQGADPDLWRAVTHLPGRLPHLDREVG